MAATVLLLMGARPASAARPFTTSHEKLTRSFVPPSQAAPGLPHTLDTFMERALDPDPARRYHSAAEFLGAFEAALGGGVTA